MEELFGYQRQGVEWMKNREKIGKDGIPGGIPGGILADEMGLGKTRQAITLMKESPVPYTLVVLPKILLQNWTENFKKFGMEFSVFSNNFEISKVKLPGIIIVTEGFLSRRCLAKNSPLSRIQKWDRVFIDEGHFILNSRSQKTLNLSLFDSEFWWIITGTPFKLTNTTRFTSYVRLITKSRRVTTDHALQVLKQITLSRKIQDLDEMKDKFPTKTIEIVSVDPKNQDVENYDKICHYLTFNGANHLETAIRSLQGTLVPQHSLNFLKKKYRNEETEGFEGFEDFEDFENDEEYAVTAKMNAVCDSYVPGSKTIVFCRFNVEINRLYHTFKKNGISVGTLTGKNKHVLDTIHQNKEIHNFENILARRFPLEIVQIIGTYAFIPPDVLLCQSSVASVGLNLQYYDSIFFTTPLWSIWDQNQAIARAYRYGQKSHVTVKVFATKNTYDQYLINQHSRQQELEDEFNRD